jgi:hypothetical protein
MFKPYTTNSRFGPALRAINRYTHVFDGDGNGWVSDGRTQITIRVTPSISNEDAMEELTALEYRLEERDIRVALSITYRRMTDFEHPTTDIYVNPHRLFDLITCLKAGREEQGVARLLYIADAKVR